MFEPNRIKPEKQIKVETFLLNIYGKFQFNLGFKTKFINPLFLYLFSKIKGLEEVLKYLLFKVIDTLLFSLFRSLKNYLYRHIIIYYGADYCWGDEKSQNLNRQQANLGYGLFHQALILNQKPRRVLCVGSMYGFIPFMMTRAVEDNQVGIVDFVDAGFDVNDKKDKGRHIFGQGFWRKAEVKKHFRYLLRGNRLKTYVMTTKEFARKYSYKYDYIYLDGDHRYRGMVEDIKMFWPKLRIDGYLCLHDIDYKKVSKGITFGVWRIWQQLSKLPRSLKVSNNYSGIGLLQKTENLKQFKDLKLEAS